MTKIVYNTEVRKSGYEWGKPEDLADKLIEWDPEISKYKAKARAGIYKSPKKEYKNNFVLVPADPSPTAQMIIKPMEKDTWISFYRVAEKTNIGTKPLPDDEIRAELQKFFKQHGIANGEIADFSIWKDHLLTMNDLFLARDEGNMEEVYAILKESLEGVKTTFKDVDNFHLLLKLKLSLNPENKLEMTHETSTLWDFITYDYLFSNGLLQRWFTCKQCSKDFPWKRKKDYCTDKCKNRAHYERQLIRRKK